MGLIGLIGLSYESHKSYKSYSGHFRNFPRSVYANLFFDGASAQQEFGDLRRPERLAGERRRRRGGHRAQRAGRPAKFQIRLRPLSVQIAFAAGREPGGGGPLSRREAA